MSFVCRGDDNDPKGHLLNECPEYASDVTTRRLVGLVTQTATNEVALVDLYGGKVIDVDKSTPGFSFLRVGARPGAIVTTPGGAASFVAVSGLQKNGIFALPSTCLDAPTVDEPPRDLTTWSACALSSAPGDVTVLLDSSNRTACGSEEVSAVPTNQDNRVCPADVTAEKGPAGRRKLLVALPDEHKLVLLDAQALLDRPAGEFGRCDIEREYALDATLPTTPVQPSLPDDLKNPTGSCPVTSYPPPVSTEPTPGGFALSDNRLYVADRTLPVVHRIDVSDPCDPRELDPLLPYAYTAPERVVTTSRIAVSPVTPLGKQYLYAIDENDQPTASVMAFELGEGANPAPIVFPGAPRQPYLPPDRLRFSAPVRDLRFVMRDFPAPDESGVGTFGVSCDPDPSSSGVGVGYRPTTDFTEGARSRNLRGVFGFAMLTNGQIAVIDVEDFDAPCRRPTTGNLSSVPDFRGCANDALASYIKPATETSAAVPTVTGEVSCNVIEAHRPRAAQLAISSDTNGLRAPTLRSFPQFSNPDPSTVVPVEQQPHVQAVDFPNPDSSSTARIPAQVYVGTQLYVNCPEGASPAVGCESAVPQLAVDPNQPLPQNTLTLPLAEPRSYAQDESPALTFEGKVFADRKSGYLQFDANPGLFRDPDASFCGAGVEDSDAVLAEADSLGLPIASQSDSARTVWANAHADYVQITGDFPVSTDRYWTVGKGNQCATILDSTRDPRSACNEKFGNIDNPAALQVSRDLRIVRAFNDRLEVEPRNPNLATLEGIDCCFPSGTAYTVRASNQWLLTASAGLTDIGPDAEGRCVHTASCDPKKKYFRSRAFEVCTPTETDLNPPPDDPEMPRAGFRRTRYCREDNENLGCVVDQVPIGPAGDGSACIFENLTSRFVVYRGAQPSTRGMTFTWQTTGGFTPMTMALVSQTNAVNPQGMAYLPEVGYIAVVDAASLGLVLFNLNSLGVVSPSPYF